jgi:hypothetical protein
MGDPSDGQARTEDSATDGEHAGDDTHPPDDDLQALRDRVEEKYDFCIARLPSV